MKFTDYNIEINGLSVKARYSEESINNIFLPLLRKLTKIQKEKNRRILVMLAAPPAAGKSTLVSFLQHLSRSTPYITPITAIGMDGFHHYQDYLLSHTTTRNGSIIPMVKIKGAPITFNIEALSNQIKKVASGAICGWPEYNRLKHNPEENAITVNGNIVLLEGNYLLLNQPGWNDLSNYADYTISIKADKDLLKERLISRKCASGTAKEEAISFVEFSDLENVKTCLLHSKSADLNLVLNSDSSYSIASNNTNNL